MMPPDMEAILNKIDPPGRVIMFAVPTRILRMVDLKGDWMTFDIQQLHQLGSALGPFRGEWRAVSKHTGGRPGEAMQTACDALKAAQKKLMEEVRAEGKRRAALAQGLKL